MSLTHSSWLKESGNLQSSLLSPAIYIMTRYHSGCCTLLVASSKKTLNSFILPFYCSHMLFSLECWREEGAMFLSFLEIVFYHSALIMESRYNQCREVSALIPLMQVWDFKGRQLKCRWGIGHPIVKINYHHHNGLLAAVVDDYTIQLVDVVNLKLVRKFEGHTDRITDLSFSEDGKWLVSSSMDGSLRIWDVILARQIDAMLVDVPITALSLSPNMDILATTHADKNGVYLWVNQAMFSSAPNVDSFISGKHVVSFKLPSISSSNDSQVEHSDKLAKASEHKDVPGFAAQDKHIPDLVTLSLLPKSQWQSLISLDIIKARNKPIEPPKKPEKAPFFLATVPSISGEILFEPSKLLEKEKDETSHEGEIFKKVDTPPSRFLYLLKSSAEGDNYASFTDYIKGLSPSNLDMELRMLQIIDDGDQQEYKKPELVSIEQLLDYFIHELSCKNNFEFLQAVIKLFLKIHGETIRQQSQLQDKARKLLDVQCLVWQKVERLFQSARCVVAFLSNTQI